MSLKPISVSQLNSYIKRVIGTDPILGNISVTGEISNLIKHSSGHFYFVLKDELSRISCFLPSDRISAMRFDLAGGMQIIAYGNVSVYEKGGSYSLSVRDIDPAGEGALNTAFENLKNKLVKEGIFDAAHKKSLPKFPKKVAIITSPTGAAVRDVISTIKRRNTLVDILVYPCLVQGKDAAQSISDALNAVNAKFDDIDIIILCRGGGSLEDLWAFNEEVVAKAIYNSVIPVISAVGHETDTLISDYAADLRAATPTAAAEHAVPDIAAYADMLSSLKEKADSGIVLRLSKAGNRLQMLGLDIKMSNPMNMLNRGYAIVRAKSGKWLVSTRAVAVGDELTVVMKDGRIRCLVENLEVVE